ncbi:nucleotide-binding protein [Clostridia bacterium]|nr:nucleotide-binding protein [Clostridia bacterium]
MWLKPKMRECVIITGLSGAGKTVAIKSLEDIGFYPIDNMPIQLVKNFIELAKDNADYDKVAIGIDIRTDGNFENIAEIIKNEHIKVIYIEASTETIIKRYKETRRSHPLYKDDDNILNAIENEYTILSPLRENADYIINSSLMGTAKLKEEVIDIFLEKHNDSMEIKISSFGFKFGADTEADLLFDVRFLPNPFYVKELRNKTGLDRDVRDFVMQHEASQKLFEKLKDLLDFMLPLYLNEGKNRLVISFGCTGGKHRSVTFAELFSEYLKDYKIITKHRDLKR